MISGAQKTTDRKAGRGTAATGAAPGPGAGRRAPELLRQRGRGQHDQRVHRQQEDVGRQNRHRNPTRSERAARSVSGGGAAGARRPARNMKKKKT